MEAGSCARTTKRCEMLLLPLGEWRCVGEHSSTGLNMLVAIPTWTAIGAIVVKFADQTFRPYVSEDFSIARK